MANNKPKEQTKPPKPPPPQMAAIRVVPQIPRIHIVMGWGEIPIATSRTPTRMPEFSAPKLGTRSNMVTVDVDVPADASGVLYSLGGFSGGLATFMESGKLCYEYNLFEMERTRICASEKIPAGRSKIVVETLTKPKPAANGGKSFYQSAEITVRVNGKAVAQGTVPLLATLLFTANDCLDFGSDLGSPVSLDYLDKAPFPFTGKIIGANVKYPQAAAVPVIVADPD